LELYIGKFGNPWFDTRGGNNTFDYVFLLGLDEVLSYFGDSGMLLDNNDSGSAIDDQYNNNRIAIAAPGLFATVLSWEPNEYIGGTAGPWWIRSPAGPGGELLVTSDGIISLFGHASDHPYRIGIRPALWINLVSE